MSSRHEGSPESAKPTVPEIKVQKRAVATQFNAMDVVRDAVPALRGYDREPLTVGSYTGISSRKNLGEVLRALKVLVVEDFEQFRQLTCSLLRERAECLLVDEAFDGLEAVQKIEELRPDLILLDIGLPKLNGIKVAERARKIVPHARLLFISQESSSDVIEESLRVGGHGYVLKQRAGSDLLPAIEAVLQGDHFVSSGLEFGLAMTGSTTMPT